MNKNIIPVVCGLVIGMFLLPNSRCMAWGVWGHSKINRGAVLALPKEMGMFFYNHADYITEEAVAPDIRKYTMHDGVEHPRHYINIEKYNGLQEAEKFKTVSDVYTKFAKDSVNKYGTLPWTIQEMVEKLSNAMRNKNKPEILFVAANLAHYVGDAHMPLHTTIFHDGETKDQAGIHGLWESQLPELFGKDYSLFAEAKYIDNVEAYTWEIIEHSNGLVKEVLYNDKKLRADKPENLLFKMSPARQPAKTKFGTLIYAYEYAHVYHELLGGMVEKQMRAAVAATASYWYTAWINAGKPDLSELDPKYLSERNQKYYQEDMGDFKKGRVMGFKVMTEYK
ncbi:MAG: S1/P1 Nuclease [Chitinophagia bacterium]|nr:S1/P1 Nuclease [Chitinophagia bacterium]